VVLLRPQHSNGQVHPALLLRSCRMTYDLTLSHDLWSYFQLEIARSSCSLPRITRVDGFLRIEVSHDKLRICGWMLVVLDNPRICI
jgi:hypothetical protein